MKKHYLDIRALVAYITKNVLHMQQIPEEMMGHCINEINEINYARFRNLTLFGIVAVTGVFSFFTFYLVQHPFDSLYLSYVIADAFYLVFLVLCYLIFYKQLIDYKKQFSKSLLIIFCVSLLWATVLSILDKNMTCYVMALLLFPISFAIKPRFFIYVQLLIALPLAVALPIFHADDFTLLSCYINLLFGGFLSVFMCVITYNSTLENICNKKIIENKNTELKELSETDILTTNLNRRKFNEIMENEWRRAFRNNSIMVFIMIDVDSFKKYNDTYGHLKGDECLRLIGKTLKTNFRRITDYVARYGGEEFSVVMVDSCEEDGIDACKRIMKSIQELNIPHSQSDISNIVTVSMGMAVVIPTEKDCLVDLIHNADLALYEAKETGRNRYVVFPNRGYIRKKRRRS